MLHRRALKRKMTGFWALAGLLWTLQACGEGQAAQPPDRAVESRRSKLPDGPLPEAGPWDAGQTNASPPARPWILGHKGAGTTHPTRRFAENTLTSAQHALSQGAEGLELDVWKTADGVVVLGHDDPLDSQPPKTGTPRTDCSGRISQAAWSELTDCRVLPAHPHGDTEPLSTLDELLDATEHIQLLLLDLKVDDSGDRADEARATVAAIASRLAQRNASAPVLLGLYQTQTRLYAAELGLSSCLKYHGHLGWDDAELLSHLDAVDDWGLCVNYCIFSQGLAHALKRRAREVLVYANDPDGTQVVPATLDRILLNLRLGDVGAFLTDDVPGARASRQQPAAWDAVARTPQQECGDSLRIRRP